MPVFLPTLKLKCFLTLQLVMYLTTKESITPGMFHYRQILAHRAVNRLFFWCPCSRHLAEPLSMKWALRRLWKVQQLVWALQSLLLWCLHTCFSGPYLSQGWLISQWCYFNGIFCCAESNWIQWSIVTWQFRKTHIYFSGLHNWQFVVGCILSQVRHHWQYWFLWDLSLVT
jgi:hypothetical protein